MTEADRDELRAALATPAFYPDRPASVEERETHISWIYLAGDRVLKIKKALTLPFLDYGTLARRRFMCREEVRLNRRLAPDVYLGVVSIVRRDGGLELVRADVDEAVEYAVEMTRLAEERTLDRLLERGELDERAIARVAERLARFHRDAEVAAPAAGRPAALRRPLDETFETLLDLAPEVPPDEVAALARFADAFLARRSGQLVERAEAGRVRDGHGDLRAEHVLVDAEVRAFDCVEFDPALREIDVASDLAFLVMDLAARGGGELGRPLVRAYRDAGGDPGDDALVGFYAAYRAAVRAKVAFGWAARLDADPVRRDEVRAEGRALLALARRFAWQARGPLVLVVCGPAASGKTHLARRLAAVAGLPHLSSDVVRKREAGLAPTERGGESLYGDAASERTYRELAAGAGEALRARGGAIVDATFRRERDRRAFAAALTGAAPLYVECRAPRATILARARARLTDPELTSDATAEIAERQLDELEPLDEVPAHAHVVLRTDRSVEELESELAALVDERLGGTAAIGG